MTKNAKAFKIADPILQSVLFVLLAYSFDYAQNFKIFLPAIIGWQLISSVINFFIRTRAKLKIERLIYFVLVAIFILAFLFMRHHTKEKFLNVFVQQGVLSIPIYELVFFVLQGLFAVWYYVICFREIKSVMDKVK